MLDALNTAIQAKLNGGLVQSYSIAGRNIQYMSLRELRDLRNDLKGEVAAGQDRRTYAEFEDPS